MKDSEPNRYWIIWILFGLLLPLLAVFLRMRHQPQSSEVDPPKEPTIRHATVGEKPQNRYPAITEEEKEVADAALEELLVDALSAGNNEVGQFLHTDYGPLSKWLDERFEIDLTSMSPSQIFDVVPLNDINYEVEVDPARSSKASFQASNISRRELLKRIADHWNLHLEIKYDDEGLPTAVQVRDR